MIAGLQAAFILFHNKAVDLVARDRRGSAEEVFRKARQLTTWHYQWMIVNEFLPLFVGRSMVEDIVRRGRRFYRPDVPFIPVEFQGAAYRFGHSMVRPSYRANLFGDVGPDGAAAPFFAMIFDPAAEGQRGPRRPARRRPRAAALHRLADLLQLRLRSAARRRRRHARRGHAAQQADRHADLHPAVRSADRRDRVGRPAHRAPPAQPPPPRHLAAPLGPEHRAADGSARALARTTWPICGASARASTSPRRSGTTS